MPLYSWVEEVSGKQVEILRSFDEYRDTPTKEEAEAAGITTDEPQWKKLIGTHIHIIKGASWGGSKGNW